MFAWLSAIILSAWVATAAVRFIDGPARARREVEERRTILDVIEAMPDARLYAIQQEAKRRIGYSIGSERLFPIMYRLEEDGLVTSRWGVAPAGTPYRPRLYRLASRST